MTDLPPSGYLARFTGVAPPPVWETPRTPIVRVDYDLWECTLLGHDAQPLSCVFPNPLAFDSWCVGAQLTGATRLGA